MTKRRQMFLRNKHSSKSTTCFRTFTLVVPATQHILLHDTYLANSLSSFQSLLYSTLSVRPALTTLFDRSISHLRLALLISPGYHDLFFSFFLQSLPLANILYNLPTYLHAYYLSSVFRLSSTQLKWNQHVRWGSLQFYSLVCPI